MPPWERYQSARPPANPEFPYKGPQAQATLGKTQAEIEAIRQRNAIERQKASLEERKFQLARQKAQTGNTKSRAAKKSQVMDLMNDILAARRIKRDAGDSALSPGLGEVGTLGSVLRNIPGTAARDMEGQLGALKSSIARSSLSKMRQESPTGGAVGNASDRDIDLLEASRGPIDQGANYNDFARNMNAVESRTWAELEKVSPAGARILRERLAESQEDDDESLIRKYLK